MKTLLAVVVWLTLGYLPLLARTSDTKGWTMPHPSYPEEMRQTGVQGRGKLHCRTDDRGRVVEAHMDPGTGSPGLDEAAVRFARANWRGPASRTRTDEIVYVLKRSPVAPGLKAYEDAVQNAVGQRWLASVGAAYQEVRVGVVRLGFLITPAGKVKNVRVLTGKEQQRLVSLSASALLEANIPPMSAAVRAALPAGGKGNLVCTFNFEVKP